MLVRIARNCCHDLGMLPPALAGEGTQGPVGRSRGNSQVSRGVPYTGKFSSSSTGSP